MARYKIKSMFVDCDEFQLSDKATITKVEPLWDENGFRGYTVTYIEKMGFAFKMENRKKREEDNVL